MKTQLSQSQAIDELTKLKALNDEKEYCMTLNPWAKGKNKWRVGEKTAAQKQRDQSNPALANKKFSDFIREYDITDDLH